MNRSDFHRVMAFVSELITVCSIFANNILQVLEIHEGCRFTGTLNYSLNRIKFQCYEDHGFGHRVWAQPYALGFAPSPVCVGCGLVPLCSKHRVGI